MGAEGISKGFARIILKCFALLFVSEVVSCYPYPLFEGRDYHQTVPIRHSAYFTYPISHHRSEYQQPDYDEVFISPQEDYTYNAHEKYPHAQYFGYYPSKDYYRDKTVDGFEYFDDRIPQDSMDEIAEDLERENIYPFGQEMRYEEELPRYDSNAEADEALLQNMMMAQMYRDANIQNTNGYDTPVDDDEDQHSYYGIPVTNPVQKEQVNQYFKNKEDEEVRELEFLARKKNKSKKFKDEEAFKKQKNLGVIEIPTKRTPKMMQGKQANKQIIVSNRKNNQIPTGEGLILRKKQTLNPVDMQNNFWNVLNGKSWPSHLELATNSKEKLNVNKHAKSTTELGVSDSRIKVETSSAASVSSTPAPKRPVSVGQKEVVLPRPSNLIRRPYLKLSSRSMHQPSVYDTINKLLNMDKDHQKSELSQPQKRFVLNEDQLTSELSGLKKLSA